MKRTRARRLNTRRLKHPRAYRRRLNPRSSDGIMGPNTLKLVGIAVVGVLVWDWFTGSLGLFRMFGMGSSSGTPAPSVLPGAGFSPAVPTPGSPQPRPTGNTPSPGTGTAPPSTNPTSTGTATPSYTPPPPPPHATQPEFVNRVAQFKATETTNPAYYRQRLVNAAKGEAGSADLVAAAGIKFNADQWNWFRSQDGGSITTVDLFPADNREYQMTVLEYLKRRDDAGLTGLGEIALRHPYLYMA